MTAALLVADASPVVGFVAADQHGLLWQVVLRTHGQILVPAHVDGEITRIAATKSRKASTNYQWMKKQGQIKALPGVGVTGPVAAAAAATLLDGKPDRFHDYTKDLGEALTVAHARELRRRNTAADVLIDDRQGVAWAETYKITCRGTVWVFAQAIDQQHIATNSDLDTA